MWLVEPSGYEIKAGQSFLLVLEKENILKVPFGEGGILEGIYSSAVEANQDENVQSA